LLFEPPKIGGLKNGASLSIRILHMIIISAAASGFCLPESKIFIKK
jgi:hypothetical protein